jgi:hypothetical protein
MSVHVSPTAAIALSADRTAESALVPPELVRLLAVGEVEWLPGLRALSPGCTAKTRPKEVQYREQLVKRCKSRAAAAVPCAERESADGGGAAAPTFRFAVRG